LARLEVKSNKYTMKPESYQLFAQLLEGHLLEASSAMNMLATKPGGPEVVKHLHKTMKLAHDLGYSPIDKISWSELKGSSYGKWVLIQGATGTGAIKAINDRYEAVASVGGEVKQFRDSKGGNVLDFLKGEIGKLQKFYTARGSRAVDDKQKKRAEFKQGAGAQEVNKETLVKKFKPLWIRAMTAAIADIKGHVANMIKNDAFAKASKKLKYIESLQTSLEELEGGSTDTPEFISRAVQTAIYMAASYHYPDQTGNITKSGWGGGYSAQSEEGPRLLLKDISTGDTKKLGTVLGFFKRTLISG
jgi:hypothetical protein